MKTKKTQLATVDQQGTLFCSSSQQKWMVGPFLLSYSSLMTSFLTSATRTWEDYWRCDNCVKKHLPFPSVTDELWPCTFATLSSPHVYTFQVRTIPSLWCFFWEVFCLELLSTWRCPDRPRRPNKLGPNAGTPCQAPVQTWAGGTFTMGHRALLLLTVSASMLFAYDFVSMSISVLICALPHSFPSGGLDID